MKFGAQALLLKSLGARAVIDLGWRFLPGMQYGSHSAWTKTEGNQTAVLTTEGLCCLFPRKQQPKLGESLLAESRPSSCCSGETLPSSGLWAGDPMRRQSSTWSGT